MRSTLELMIVITLAGTTGCATSRAGGDSADGGSTPEEVDARRPADARAGAVADAAGAPTDAAPVADAVWLPGKHGFPGDFPELTDSGGFGQGEIIEGFGGDTTTDRAGNRAQITHRPVILLHGNGTTATDDTFGMTHVGDMLEGAGYTDAEIWAPSYLGQSVSYAETPTPYRNNIGDVRQFIDAVLDYTGAPRVDVVAHSLGCGLINGYLRGLASDGSFDPSNDRFARVGTVVCLGGALYGTGVGFLYEPEFATDGQWVAAGLQWNGNEDGTPYGADDTAAMIAPATGQLPGNRPFRATTPDDDGSRRIYWVALWATGDVVDGSLPGACALGGADLNQGFDLPQTLPGVLTAQLAMHGQLLHSAGVFAALLPYLDR